MSRLEEVWRGWQALNMHDRARFLHLFREAYRQEREERMVANRRPAGEPVTISDFDRMTLAALDRCAPLDVGPGGRPMSSPAGLRSVSLPTVGNPRPAKPLAG